MYWFFKKLHFVVLPVNYIDVPPGISKELVLLLTSKNFCMGCDKNFKAENEMFVSYISFLVTLSHNV